MSDTSSDNDAARDPDRTSGRDSGADRRRDDARPPRRDGQRPSRDGQRPNGDRKRADREGQRPARDGQRPYGDRNRPARDGQRPVRDGQRPGTGRPASGKPASGTPASGRPWQKRDDARGERRPASGDRGGQNKGGQNRGGQYRGGEKSLWTREGRPARGDRDARDAERTLTEEERLARELRSVRPRHEAPEIPDDVTGRDLDRVARNELKTLSKENAEEVARHLVMAARLIDDDPELAHQHALSAERRAGRIAIVRETLAITSYAIGDFALAIRELRTYRRISGSNNQLPLMVDSERGVGRPDRALEVGRSVDRDTLPADVQVSLAIAMSGARLDLGQPDAALAELEIPQLSPDTAYSYSPDLFHAYAEVLEELGRTDDAERWRRRAETAEDALEEATGAGLDETIEVIEEDGDDHDGDDQNDTEIDGAHENTTEEPDAAAAKED